MRIQLISKKSRFLVLGGAVILWTIAIVTAQVIAMDRPSLFGDDRSGAAGQCSRTDAHSMGHGSQMHWVGEVRRTVILIANRLAG